LLRLDQALAILGWYRVLLGEALLSKTRVSMLGLKKIKRYRNIPLSVHSMRGEVVHQSAILI
jgi:hypothetical protein